MFKRANKITALLVAAASVMTVVPAMADDSSTSRLGSKDGTIENAIAYQDGKYVYQGYKSDDDTDAIYYNDGSQDKALDDVSDADLNTTYADKYAFTNDGTDQYLVDLTSGDVTDDTTPADDADSAATKLQTKLKKTDRYGDNVSATTYATTPVSFTAADTFGANNDGADYEEGSLATIPGNKFGDTWYAYNAYTASNDAASYIVGKDVNGGGYLYGFTDLDGKYIDMSYTANIYAYSTREGKTVKIDNYSSSYDDVDSDSGLLATLAGQPVALTQDKDYIYALVTVNITDQDATVSTGAGTTTSAAATWGGSSTGVTTQRTYIQKVSKDQGDQQDDAYLPKTVETYEIGNKNSEYDCGDATDAFNAVGDTISAGSSTNADDIKLSDGTYDLSKVTQSMVTGKVSSNGIAKPLFTTSNGDLIAVKASTDSIDAITLKFKKDKLKFEDTHPGYKAADPTTWNMDTKVDAYMLEKDSDDSVDLTDVDTADQYEAYDIDVNGNVWMVADGKIYKYTDGGNFTETYTCDSSLDAISVYDDSSMVAWENNGDIYTTVNEGKAETSSEDGTGTTTGAATVQTGWVQLADGTWNFYDATGTKLVNNWSNVGGVWYYLGADGVMATGWANVGGTWYYLNASGAMQTGWVNDNGTWYYLNASGAMATGWVNDNGTWYYLNASGAMLANTTVDGYVLGASGAWIQ